jgi:hypothetical protein
LAGSQESSVQGLLSLQFGAGPPWQLPRPHVSPVVHALPSLQGLVLSEWAHPVGASQESLVHGLLSSQFGGGPPLQVPPPQVSPVVHALPSLQGLVLSEWAHPVSALHESLVHGLLSSQPSAGPPLHVPPLQTSFVVQALPSSHAFALLT